MRWLNVFFAAVLLLPGPGAAAAEIIGTASYRDRTALPPGAVFMAVLEDVSVADAPAIELGRAEIRDPGTPPFAFEIDYDPARIAPERRYTVRTQVSLDGRLLYASDTMNPVLTGGAPPSVEVGMVRIAAGPAGEAPETGSVTAGGLRLPAGFAGTLPCADCDGVDTLLDLWPDQVFHLRRSWEGKDTVRDTIGRWTEDEATGAIVLRAADETLAFRILGDDGLEAMPRDDEAAPDREDHAVLTMEARFAPFEPHLPLRGMLTYAADATRFTECLTGRDYPVVADGDFPALEHAFIAAGSAIGLVMASFDGAIVAHPSADGAGPVPSVLVERFVGIWPGETCESAMGPSTLTNTYWKILRLGATELAAGNGRREPNLILRDGDGRFSATVGCNAIAGTYTREGDQLRFGPAGMTRMGCPPPLDAWEAQLADILARTDGWRIDGKTLQLLDAAGTPLALMQAVYLY